MMDGDTIPAASVVRPGRVDDLAFAIAKRAVLMKAPPMAKAMFQEAEPIIQALCTRYLGKLKMPGVPRTRNTPRKKKVASAN